MFDTNSVAVAWNAEDAARPMREAVLKIAEAHIAGVMSLDGDRLAAFEAEVRTANLAIGRAQALIRGAA